MTSNSDNESESSLPIQTAQSPSSPPILKIDASILDMDVNPALMSEPALAQDVEASRPALHGVSSDDTERPPSAQQLHHDSREQGDVDDDKELHDKESDPAERIAEFDWDDLHARYHEAVGKCHGEEAELMQEWEALMIFFRTWAESGHAHETNRSFHRLQTRTTYVRHSEDTLEKTRNHYVNVVRAFESALNLLKANSFGR